MRTNEDLQKDVQDAIKWEPLLRAAEQHHDLISGSNVKLTGIVDSWYEKEEAHRISWNAPGVKSVDNELVVEYDYSMAL